MAKTKASPQNVDLASAQPEAKTAKGRATRARLLDAARHLFATRGYGATTMRDVAAEAGCATGLAYRYFARREDLAAALYDELAVAFDHACADIPAGSLAERFDHVMRLRLEQLRSHRPMLRALLPLALEAGSGFGVFGAQTSPVRARVAGVFERVADPDDDGDDDDDSLGRVLYFAHLAVLLVWLLEAGDGDAAARAALALCRDGLSWGGPFLKSPVTRLLLERLQTIVNVMTDEGGNRA